jgi:hypothetical protein
MKKSRHSYPLLSAKGSEGAAASSVASAARGQGNMMKLKKSDLVSGIDGEDVKVALYGSLGEVSCKKILPTNLKFRLRGTKRYNRPWSPSSCKCKEAQATGEASSPCSRKKRSRKRFYLVPSEKLLKSPSNNVDGDELASPPRRKNNIIKQNVMVRLRKRSSRPRSPSSGTDLEAQSSGDEKHHSVVTSYFSGDVSINKADGVESANKIDPPTLDTDINIEQSHAFDNCLDVTPSSISEEISWTRYKMVNAPTTPTEEMQNYLDLDQEAIMTSISSLYDNLNLSPPAEVEFCSTYDEKQLAEVYKRLSRYCIQAHELSSPGEELADQLLNEELECPLHVYENVIYQHKKVCPEWYFHPEQCKLAGLDDYQRLVLRDDFLFLYGDWDYYRLTYHTYQGDLEYVHFCDELSKKIKWIEDETALFGDQWPRYELVAFLQSLEIAVQFPNIFARSVISGLNEHLDSLRFYLDSRKDWDGVYLEIWKRVAKYKVKFDEVLMQLHEENIFPFRRHEIKSALDDPGVSLIKYNYENFVDRIDAKFSEDEARPLLVEAVEKMFPRRKNYLDYARKKMEIAVRIGLIPN